VARDRAFASARRCARAASGRFNAGQKVNFVLVCILLAALYITVGDTIFAGTHHNLIFGGHKLATIGICLLVVGHLYMALVDPATRHALRGMLTGDVDRDWARKHYPRWKP
jgi:formate dehydrogenase subunit gamma